MPKIQRTIRMHSGQVKFFDAKKTFGFIKPDNGDEDVFVHISALQRAGLDDLVAGQKVKFDLEPSRKPGKQAACNLKLA